MKEEKPSLYVTCASELEPLLAEELQELGFTEVQIGFRGVYVDNWDWNAIYKINYASRVATRVLLPITKFKCFNIESLYRGIIAVNWSSFIQRGSTIAIDANVHHRDIRNSLFAAQKAKDAICDQLREKAGWRPSVNIQEPDVQLNLYIQNNMAILSFDTSGIPLHKRGYRIESVEAPIQETLAAAVLRLAKYDKDQILLDPCCGSGTFLIEAALMATCTPPGYLRHRWGFMRHPDFNQLEWLKVRGELDKKRVPLEAGKIAGFDLGKECVRVCKSNLRAAGFLKEIDVKQADFRDYKPEVLPNFLVANPPYGKRLEDEERLIPLYRALGDFYKQYSAKPAMGYIFTGNLELAKEIGLAAKRRIVLNSGGIESRLLEYELY